MGEVMDAVLSELEADCAPWREHKYKGGKPDRRTYARQLAHESRARRMGVRFEQVDLREVFRRDKGICGICGQPVPFETFTVDHIVPLAKGGPHVLDNLRVAHGSCNSRKGDR